MEYERKMKEAEEKKNKKRKELSALRQDFVLLLQKNQELPKHMQLHGEVHFYEGHLPLKLLHTMLGQKMSDASD